MKFYKVNKDMTVEVVADAIPVSSCKIDDLVIVKAAPGDWRVCDYWTGSMVNQRKLKTKREAKDFCAFMNESLASAILSARASDSYKARAKWLVDYVKENKI